MSAETVLTQAQIDDATGVLYGTMANHQETQFARAVEQAVLQSPEVQRLRENAERYQVLRNEDYQMLEDDPCVTDELFNAFFGEDLDEAVDALASRRHAAMREQP